VSTLPSVHGEKVVIRVLPSESVKVKLDSIGLSAEEHALVKRVLSSPNGLILVTGPTGSGKTTTLYTMLDSLNTPQRNIVTVEDPVEYQLAGITQVQVNASIGYTFERVLRSFLRQDPDVMLVGEIRDAETGEIALKAAVTGRIVLSTLHTNDAAAAVHRLIGMGLSAHLVAAATRLVIAQRLVRKLCPACRTPSAPTSEEILAFEGEGEKAPQADAAQVFGVRKAGPAAREEVHLVAGGREFLGEAEPDLFDRAALHGRHGQEKSGDDRDFHGREGGSPASAASRPAVVWT